MSEFVKYYSSQEINETFSFSTLIEALRKGFAIDYAVPKRMHVDYQTSNGADKNTLLLMPAIDSDRAAGVKIVTVNPGNGRLNLPGIQGVYYLFDPKTGTPKALIDGKALTNWRTAATSALAASYLANKDASKMLMIGTGSLAPFLIDAHSSQFPIEHVMIWGRNAEKAEALAQEKRGAIKEVTVVQNLDEALQEADIISTATFSYQPLIKGSGLRPGQHLDLVGAYKPTMREVDDETLLRSRIYVDSIENAPIESGDLAIPIKNGVISTEEIKGDLFQLAREEVVGRQTEEEITIFKSVGHAMEDLVAAQLLTQSI